MVYIAIVESIRNTICLLSNNFKAGAELHYKDADIRSIIYSVNKQYEPLISKLEPNERYYLSGEKDQYNWIRYIVKLMVETGEIIDLSHGKYVLAPYKTIDIGLKDRVLVQGGVSPSKWFMNTNCFLSGVSRILPKDCIEEAKFPQNYSLQNWLMMPYTGDKLVEWTETIVGNLKYKKVLLDDQIQIYNPFISNNLHINRWINIGDVNSSFEYTIGRSRGIEGYSYWVLKDVKNGAYRSIASVDKYFLIRLLYGIDTISSASTSIFFSADEESVFLYLPNRIPGEEMKIIKVISYPWPQICKNTYKWVISRELWEIIYPILVNLKLNIREVQNIY